MDSGSYQVKGGWKFWNKTGWIKLSRTPKGIELMWSSGKDTHFMLSGPAVIVEITFTGELQAFWESAITMWPKWGYGKTDPKEYARGLEEAKWMIDKVCNNSAFRGM